MIVLDVNVLIYSCRKETARHEEFAHWLQTCLSSEPRIGIPDVVLSGVVRIITNPRIFPNPLSTDAALNFCSSILSEPNVVRITAGPRHWEIFCALCRQSGARGNMISDAYLAAIAIEQDAEFLTADRDFARFPGLRWRHPLATA